MPSQQELAAPSRRQPGMRFVQCILNGEAVDVAYPPSLVRAGNVLYARDTQQVFIRAAGAGGTTALWLEITGAFLELGTSTTQACPGSLPYRKAADNYVCDGTEFSVGVDSSLGAFSVTLDDGTAPTLDFAVFDLGDNASVNNITVKPATDGYLNGVQNGVVLITANGAIRAFKRDTLGHWHGGV